MGRVLWIFLLISVAHAARAPYWEIRPGLGVGPVKLGMSRAQVEQVLPGCTLTGDRIEWQGALAVRLGESGVESIEILRNRAELNGAPIYFEGERGLRLGAWWPQTA